MRVETFAVEVRMGAWRETFIDASCFDPGCGFFCVDDDGEVWRFDGPLEYAAERLERKASVLEGLGASREAVERLRMAARLVREGRCTVRRERGIVVVEVER